MAESIGSVGAYLEKLEKLQSELKGNLKKRYPKDGKQRKSFFYRGESDFAYKLVPKIFRKNEGSRLYGDDAEKTLLEELASAYHDEFRQDKTAFERILRAQHYGLPTRLLDVTLNPLIALYFACQENKNESKGRVHIFCALNDKILRAESDRLRIICNLAYLRAEDQNFIDEHRKKKEIFAKMQEAAKSSLEFPEAAYNRLIYAIRKESPGFMPAIKQEHLSRLFFVRPLYSNLRIRAQAGGFMVSAFDKKYTKIKVNKSYCISYGRFFIEAGKKESILKALDALNINEMTVFPEMEHGARYLAEKYKLKP